MNKGNNSKQKILEVNTSLLIFEKVSIYASGMLDRKISCCYWQIQVIADGKEIKTIEGSTKVLDISEKVAQYGAIIQTLRWIRKNCPNQKVTVYCSYLDVIKAIYDEIEEPDKSLVGYLILAKKILRETKADIQFRTGKVTQKAA